VLLLFHTHPRPPPPPAAVPNPEQANQRNLLTTTSTQGGPADVFNKATKPHHHPKEAVVPGKATPAAIPTTPLPNSNEAGIFKRRSNTTTHLLKPKTQESAINPKPLPELQESGTATPKRKRAPLDPKQAQTTATNPPSTPTASTASITKADKHRGLLSIHDGPANALDSASKKHRIRDAPRSTTPPPKPTSGETQHKPLTPPATPTKTAPTTTPGSALVRPLRPNHGAGPAKSGPQESGPADVFNKATRKHHHAKGSEETPLPGKTTGMPAAPGSRNLLQWGGWGSGAMSQAQAQSQSMGGMSQSQAQAQSMSSESDSVCAYAVCAYCIKTRTRCMYEMLSDSWLAKRKKTLLVVR
jgi:hypothetical protein